jgi:hypothetical protein
MNEIDLISVGAHGAGFGMRALFGSNVDRVLRQAPCPVLVARPLRPSMVLRNEESNTSQSHRALDTVIRDHAAPALVGSHQRKFARG